MDKFYNQDYRFRFATREDIDLIMDFITKLAKSHDKLHKLELNKATLINWIFDRKIANVFFLIYDDKEVGFALYTYNFFIYKGNGSIYLEDIYILEEYRKRGFGKIMFQKICQIAQRNKVYKIEWTCSSNNDNCIQFFNSIGAREINRKKIFRLDKDKIDNLISK